MLKNGFQNLSITKSGDWASIHLIAFNQLNGFIELITLRLFSNEPTFKLVVLIVVVVPLTVRLPGIVTVSSESPMLTALLAKPLPNLVFKLAY